VSARPGGRSRRGGAAGPRRLGEALGGVRAETTPATLLAAVQAEWPRVAGPAVTAQADPVSEREGVVTIACRSATWAQELDLMAPDLLERLNRALAEGGAFAGTVERLRFTADAARHS
jgi:predicted nucleic acid-binding Zn ribbon protein